LLFSTYTQAFAPSAKSTVIATREQATAHFLPLNPITANRRQINEFIGNQQKAGRVAHQQSPLLSRLAVTLSASGLKTLSLRSTWLSLTFWT
jgi:hypothetical protein